MALKTDLKSLGAGGAPLTQKRESLTQDAIRRLVRNRAAVVGGSIIIILALMAIFAPLVAPKSYEVQVLTDENSAPEWLFSIFPSMKPYAQVSNDYPLGTDYVGRDLFSRIVYGARISLSVAVIAPLISMAASPAILADAWITS